MAKNGKQPSNQGLMYVFTASEITSFFWPFVSLTNTIESEVTQADPLRKYVGFDIFVSSYSFKRHQAKKLTFLSNRNKSTDLLCKWVDWFLY